MRETWLQSLGWEDPLKKGKLPIPVFWPGEFHRLYSPWSCKVSDMTEWLSLSSMEKGNQHIRKEEPRNRGGCCEYQLQWTRISGRWEDELWRCLGKDYSDHMMFYTWRTSRSPGFQQWSEQKIVEHVVREVESSCVVGKTPQETR